MANIVKDGTINLQSAPTISAYAAAAGKKEGEGPLAEYFDYLSDEQYRKWQLDSFR